tara:strand:+ start:1526 stop:1921 length:396 start_codon:yes stop_codon:yes gene_type:complete
MDKKTILTGFNNHFAEFTDDIKRAFPENKDIYAAHTALSAMRKCNPQLLCKIWKKYIVEIYRQSIEDGDLEYFANKNYAEDFSDSYAFIVEKIDLFRKPLMDLPDSEKQKVITYLQNLTKLTDLYFNDLSV